MKNIFILAQAGEGEDSVITGGSGDDIAQETLTAEDGSNGGAGEGGEAAPKPFIPIPLIIGLMVIVMFMFLRGPKKRQKQQQQMIQSLQRNDRVRTIGGILGTIVDVKDDEITLKIDESNNTKIKVTSASISKVLSDEVK